MIAIIDYKMGNLRSVQKACEFVGFNAKITSCEKEIRSASKIILPGVGAIREAMENLNATGIAEVMLDEIKKGKPFLGICLGMQMQFEESCEEGRHKGLGLLCGDVVKLEVKAKIPHIGWNDIDIKKHSELYKDLPDNKFYFVHSYFARAKAEDCASESSYGGKTFCASVERDNIFGVQFHPEKSGDTGLKMLKNFCGIN